MHTAILDLIQPTEISCFGACLTVGFARAMSTASIRVTSDYVIQPKFNVLMLASAQYQARLKALINYTTQSFDLRYNAHKRRSCVLWSSKPVKWQKSAINTIVNTPEESFILLTYNASELLDYLSDNHLPDNVSVIGILPLEHFPVYACDDVLTDFPVILAPELVDQSVTKLPLLATRKITDHTLQYIATEQIAVFKALRNTQLEISKPIVDEVMKLYNDITQLDCSLFSFQSIFSSHKRLLFTLLAVNSINCTAHKDSQELFDLDVTNAVCQQYIDIFKHLTTVYAFTCTHLTQAERIMGYMLHSGKLPNPFTFQQFVNCTKEVLKHSNSAFARYILHVLTSHNWVRAVRDEASLYIVNPKVFKLTPEQIFSDRWD